MYNPSEDLQSSTFNSGEETHEITEARHHHNGMFCDFNNMYSFQLTKEEQLCLCYHLVRACIGAKMPSGIFNQMLVFHFELQMPQSGKQDWTSLGLLKNICVTECDECTSRCNNTFQPRVARNLCSSVHDRLRQRDCVLLIF